MLWGGNYFDKGPGDLGPAKDPAAPEVSPGPRHRVLAGHYRVSSCTQVGLAWEFGGVGPSVRAPPADGFSPASLKSNRRAGEMTDPKWLKSDLKASIGVLSERARQKGGVRHIRPGGGEGKEPELVVRAPKLVDWEQELLRTERNSAEAKVSNEGQGCIPGECRGGSARGGSPLYRVKPIASCQ